MEAPLGCTEESLQGLGVAVDMATVSRERFRGEPHRFS